MRGVLDDNNLGSGRVRSNKKYAYLEASLHDQQGGHLYTGFAGDIDSGGVFVPTYDVRPVSTPVAIRICFGDDDNISAGGVVEWVRDHNPVVPEMVPGMGVRLTSLDTAGRMRIEAHLEEHEPILYDDLRTEEKSIRAAPLVSADDIRSTADEGDLQAVPLPEVQEEQAFYKGLARDVEAYLKTLPYVGTNTPSIADERRPRSRQNTASDKTGRRIALDTVTVRVAASDRSERQFHGGFSKEDGPYRVFIASHNPLPIGERIRLLIRVPGGNQLSACGNVRWVRRYNPLTSPGVSPPGMGICLEQVAPRAWKNVARQIPEGKGYLSCELIR